MMTRMLALCACAGLLLMVASPALAGPNEGGVLVLHANPSLTFTSDIATYCGMSELDLCSEAVTTVDWVAGRKVVFHALAAFPLGSTPRLKGLSFGITYDPAKFVMAARGTCADFELPDGTWPAPGTGTGQSWTAGPQTGLLTEIYWFCGYAYGEQESEDSTSVALIPHPTQHGLFVDDGEPQAVDSVAAYGRLGFGTAGYDPCPEVGACCQPDGACQVLTFSACEAAAGAWLGGSCDPNPCPVEGLFGWDMMEATQGDAEQGGGIDEPYGNLSDYVYHATWGHPSDFYVEPGSDGKISLAIRQVNNDQGRTLWVRMIDPETDAVIWQDSYYLSMDWTVLPDLSWPRHRGMVRIQIDAYEPGDNILYAIDALGPGPVDRLHINSARLALMFDETYYFSFYVPSWASSMRLKLVPQEGGGPPTQPLWHLYDRSGAHFDSGYTDREVQYDNLPHPLRGGIWRLAINSDDYSNARTGPLEVAFRGEGASADDWWVPDHAFTLLPEQFVRAQFGPHEILPTTTGSSMWSPCPRAPEATSPYVPGGTSCAPIVKFFGPQRMDFLTWPGVNASLSIRACGGTLTYTVWQDDQGWQSQEPAIIDSGSVATVVLAAHPSQEQLWRLRIVSGSTYVISTSSPGAVNTTVPGPIWGKPSFSPESASMEGWFFVPSGVATVELLLNARRPCSEEECPGRPYTYQVYPPVILTVKRPDGTTASSVEVGANNHGAALLTAPSLFDSGRLWSFEVTVPGYGIGGHGGLEISVALGDSLPKYVSWLGPERFRIPIAVPAGDLSGLVEPLGNRNGRWRLMPPSAEYIALAKLYGSSSLADTTKRYATVPNTLSRTVFLSGPPDSGYATVDVQKMELRGWTPPTGLDAATMATPSSPFYALQRPVGLDTRGRLRPSDGGSPGSPLQTVALDGAMKQIGGEPSSLPNWARIQLHEGIAKGFNTLSVDRVAASYLNQLGCHALTTNRWLQGPVPTAAQWNSFAFKVGDSRTRDGVLALALGDEMLGNGFAPEDLRRAIYMTRKADERHPVMLGGEPTPVNRSLVRDMTEIWTDDEYYDRGSEHGGNHPICGQIDQIMHARECAYPDRTLLMYQLAGFSEDKLANGLPAYHKACPDAAGAQMLAAICLDVAVTSQFARFFWDAAAPTPDHYYDLADSNAALWAAYGPDGLISGMQKVIGWRTTPGGGPYNYEVKLVGNTHGECEYPPVSLEYGAWLDSVNVGRVGRWFALAHLGQVAGETIERTWAELYIPSGTSIATVVDDSSVSFAAAGLVTLDTVHSLVRWQVPPVSWVIGHFSWDCDPASVGGGEPTSGHVQLAVSPNPSQGPVVVRLLGDFLRPMDVDVYTAAGSRIRRLGRLGGGKASVETTWDLRTDEGLEASPGVYFIRALDSGGRPISQKLVVLR